MKTLFVPLICILVLTSIFEITASGQNKETPNLELIDNSVVEGIRSFVETDIVRLSIQNQNDRHKNVSSVEILRLDEQWRKEQKTFKKPLISSTLSNPLSAYFTRIQAQSTGLYVEIFAMDATGLNVGQSSISTDYWQGDESKFQRTYFGKADTVFIETPHYDSHLDIWRVQINLPVDDRLGKRIGAVTFEVNLSELERRKQV